MKKLEQWLPQPNETIRFNGKLFNFISIDFGGKCKIKDLKSKKVLSNIDISELQKAN
jgi:hypothetical protein